MILTKQKLQHWLSPIVGPVYLRFGRPKVPNFTPEKQEFKIDKALPYKRERRIHLCYWTFSMGARSTKRLAEQGLEAEVINIHTIKPLDENSI